MNEKSLKDLEKQLKKVINDNIDEMQDQIDRQKPKDPLDNFQLKNKIREIEEGILDNTSKTKNTQNQVKDLEFKLL